MNENNDLNIRAEILIEEAKQSDGIIHVSDLPDELKVIVIEKLKDTDWRYVKIDDTYIFIDV